LTYAVCVLGFSSFECSTFESFFRLAARRAPAYRCVADISQADIVIADADRPASLELAVRAGKLSRTLTIGGTPVPGSAAATLRPINMMALLRMLDELTTVDALGLRQKPAQMPASIHAARGPQPASIVQAAAPAVHGTPPPAAAALARRTAPIREAEDTGSMGGLDQEDGHILVVDDSDIALRFMQMRLHRLGFQVSLAGSGDEALRMLETRRYAFVFLDVMMAGMDGFETCKRIKRKRYAERVEPPCVVMLTSKGGPIDKLRGTLAGCDGYLVKPLNEPELIKVITQFDPGIMGRVQDFAATVF